MNNDLVTKTQQNNISAKRAPYESPAIIYEGLITTRAGSVPTSPDNDGGGGGGGGGADPAQIFGSPGG